MTLREYSCVDSPIYVIMPNHIHAIINISYGDAENSPTISEIVQTFKRLSTIEYIKCVKNNILPPFDKRIWQRSFYDRVIRDSAEYDKIYKYIYENPENWQSDINNPVANCIT